MNMEYQFIYDPNGCPYSQERPLPMKMEGNVNVQLEGTVQQHKYTLHSSGDYGVSRELELSDTMASI